MYLEEIATIQVGLHLKPQETGEIAYLQAKHFNFLGAIEFPSDSFVSISGKKEKHLLDDGDVLLSSKGYNNLAWAYYKKFGPAVASTTFLVVRPDLQKVNPEFLAVLFNTAKFHKHFQTLGAGSSIPSIRKSELEALPLTLPNIETQYQIVELNKLHKKNISLLEKLIDEKEKLNDAIINKLIQENNG